jgi:hypothetical protein
MPSRYDHSAGDETGGDEAPGLWPGRFPHHPFGAARVAPDGPVPGAPQVRQWAAWDGPVAAHRKEGRMQIDLTQVTPTEDALLRRLCFFERSGATLAPELARVAAEIRLRDLRGSVREPREVVTIAPAGGRYS